MIHDPLVGRRKALVFGAVAVVLVSLGAGVLAWLQPNPRPGEASIVKSAGEQLFVRVGETYHPVSNLASARIIAGAADNPVSIGDDALAAAELGAPVGIEDAPGYLAVDSDDPLEKWAVCRSALGGDPAGTDSAETIVRAGGDEQRPLHGGRVAIAADAGGEQWLLSAEGRTRLPGAEDPLGRALRRGLNIDDGAPVWEVPTEFLNVLTERPGYFLPDPLPEIWESDDGGTWARSGDGVSSVTEAEARVMTAAGAPTRTVRSSELAALADAHLDYRLPADLPELADAHSGWLCANAEGGAEIASPQGGVELSGDGVADRFVGLEAGAVVADTGHSYHVISPTGLRYRVPDVETVEALGMDSTSRAPWDVIRLLPEGSVLDKERALRVTY